MQSLRQDLRYGFRQLGKNPGFTVTGIVSLALGIGATTAVFSVVYAVLLDPYPHADAGRMVHFVASVSQNRNAITGNWQGVMLLPQVKRRVVLQLTQGSEGCRGTINIP